MSLPLCIWAIIGLGLLGWGLVRRLLERRPVPRATPLPGPMLDVRQPQLAVDRVCVSCARPFTSHPAMVETRCDECIAAAFEAHEEADRVKWERDGWERS